MTTQKPIKVLFVCVHNSARSQMAAAFLSHFADKRFEVHSAGLRPSDVVNPLAVEVMQEVGIDISGSHPKNLAEFYPDRSDFDFFITVCDKVHAEKCTILSGFAKVIQWDFEDPAALEGDWNSKLEGTRHIRDKIQTAVKSFITQISFVE